MKSFVSSLLAGALVLFATSANALLIEVSENADFSGFVIQVEDSVVAGVAKIDYDARFGDVGFNNWTMTSIIGEVNRGDADDQLHLDSVDLSGAAGTLYIRMTETDLTRNEASFMIDFGGVTAGEVSFQTFIDPGNNPFAKTIGLFDSGVISGGGFSGGGSGGIDLDGPYSMSIFATITHTGSRQYTSFDYHVTVPEPGSLALLGLGLMAAGFMRRRIVPST